MTPAGALIRLVFFAIIVEPLLGGLVTERADGSSWVLDAPCLLRREYMNVELADCSSCGLDTPRLLRHQYREG